MTIPRDIIQNTLAWEGPLSYAALAKGRDEAALRRHVLVFPGNETHRKGLFEAADGAGLASVAKEFANHGLGTVGLPTTTLHRGQVTRDFARKQMAQLFYALAIGSTLVFPVRPFDEPYSAEEIARDPTLSGKTKFSFTSEQRRYLAQVGITAHENQTLSFWGGESAGPRKGEEWLPNYYTWSLLWLKKLMAELHKCNNPNEVGALLDNLKFQALPANCPIQLDDVRAFLDEFKRGSQDYALKCEGKTTGYADSSYAAQPAIGLGMKHAPSATRGAFNESLWQADHDLLLKMQEQKDPDLFILEIVPVKNKAYFDITIKPPHGKTSAEKVMYCSMTGEAIINRQLCTEDSFRIMLTLASLKKMPWIDVSELNDREYQLFVSARNELKNTIPVQDTAVRGNFGLTMKPRGLTASPGVKPSSAPLPPPKGTNFP